MASWFLDHFETSCRVLKFVKDKITENTTLAEILRNFEAEKILAKYNLPCLGCPMAKFEIENLTLGQVSKNYNIDLQNLLKELNEKLK